MEEGSRYCVNCGDDPHREYSPPIRCDVCWTSDSLQPLIDKLTDERDMLIAERDMLSREVDRLKKREGYYAQGQTLGEWADMVEESERFWSQYV